MRSSSVKAPAAGEVAALHLTLRIRRSNPEGTKDHRPGKQYWEEFEVDAFSTDRVLDALNTVKWEQDGSLTFRRSCAHGVCGSDAVRINGRNRLACRVLLKDLNPHRPVTIEPIPGLPVIKDLVVDMEPFFESYREILPFLMPAGEPPERERLQTPHDRAKFDDTTKCILCAACTTSCPVFWTDGQFFGPAAMVSAHRFVFDSRDAGEWERLEILNDKAGVWKCRTTFNCTDACPRGIQVTEAIMQLKRAITTGEV